jgi:hypothetical protein
MPRETYPLPKLKKPTFYSVITFFILFYFILLISTQLRKKFRCEHRKSGHCAHLLLHNLQEIDTVYLEALLTNNIETILAYELAAQKDGYGPLVPCGIVASPTEQKMLCRKCHTSFVNSNLFSFFKANWHRDSKHQLIRGRLERTENCSTQFEFYYPHDYGKCPYILLIC